MPYETNKTFRCEATTSSVQRTIDKICEQGVYVKIDQVLDYLFD